MGLVEAFVDWQPCYRIIPSRYPPIDLFESVADPADLDAVFAIEALTNDRLRDEVGQLSLVPAEDRIAGPGSSVIMAAFTHLKPGGDRFTDGSFGVFYASKTVETAIAETVHHRQRFLMHTAEPAQEIDMRVYAVDLRAQLHDVRACDLEGSTIHHPGEYTHSQAFAAEIRRSGANGIVYRSIRHPGGECAAVFRPRLLGNCRQERHLCYVWDGTLITSVYEKSGFTPIGDKPR